MSQKSEKYARSLLRRMDELEARQIDSAAFSAVLHTIQKQNERTHERWRRRAMEAERAAGIWRTMCWATVAAVLIIVVLLALATPAGGAETDEPPAAPVTSAAATPPETFPPEEAEEPEDFENEKIEAALLERSTKLESVTVTHYDPCVACCGKDDGVTASGVKAVSGVTVAVDPSVIPLGSDVLVDYGDGEIHYYRADDVGGAVRGNRIDLCVADHAEAIRLGVRTATVYWVNDDESLFL